MSMQIVYIASYGVLVGGVAQIALHIYPLYRLGFVKAFCVWGGGRCGWLFSQGILRGIRSWVVIVAILRILGEPQTSSLACPLKSLKNTASTTAIPRILEEEIQAGCEKHAANQNQPQSKKVDC